MAAFSEKWIKNKFDKKAEQFWADYEGQGRDDKVKVKVDKNPKRAPVPVPTTSTEKTKPKQREPNVWDRAKAATAPKTPKPKDDLYADWRPADEMYYGPLNVGLDHGLEPACKLLGARIPMLDDCPFDDGHGSCFKEKCFRNHPSGKKPGLGEPRSFESFNFEMLPKKHVPTQLAQIHGQVTYAKSPLEFYILPDMDFACDCTKNPKLTGIANDCIQYAQYFRVGTFAHKELHKNFEQIMGKKCDEMQQMLYLRGELVTCLTSKYSWARGVVLEDADIYDNCKTVQIYLIDIGETVELPFMSVTGICKSFIFHPPLVYKCSLFGIVPVGNIFSDAACEFFQRLVVENNRLIRIQVMNQPTGNLKGVCESETIFVDLTVKVKDKHVRVADILADLGLCVQYNLFPDTPGILTKLSMSEALFMGLKPPSKENLKAIQEQEMRRLLLGFEKLELDLETPEPNQPEPEGSQKNEETTARSAESIMRESVKKENEVKNPMDVDGNLDKTLAQLRLLNMVGQEEQQPESSKKHGGTTTTTVRCESIVREKETKDDKDKYGYSKEQLRGIEKILFLDEIGEKQKLRQPPSDSDLPNDEPSKLIN